MYKTRSINRRNSVLFGLGAKLSYLSCNNIRPHFFYLLDYFTSTEIFQISNQEKNKNKNHESNMNYNFPLKCDI